MWILRGHKHLFGCIYMCGRCINRPISIDLSKHIHQQIIFGMRTFITTDTLICTNLGICFTSVHFRLIALDSMVFILCNNILFIMIWYIIGWLDEYRQLRVFSEQIQICSFIVQYESQILFSVAQGFISYLKVRFKDQLHPLVSLLTNTNVLLTFRGEMQDWIEKNNS